MSTSDHERTGRRGFFLSLAAGLGEAVADVGEQIVSGSPPSSPAEVLTAEPAPQRRSVPPSAIPDVRR